MPTKQFIIQFGVCNKNDAYCSDRLIITDYLKSRRVHFTTDGAFMSHFSSLHLKLCRYNSDIKMTLKLLIHVLVYICVFNCVTCLEDYAFEGKTVLLNIVFRCIVLVPL